jgi:hypothetical protein
VALKLRRIGEGCWRTDGDTKKLRTQEPGLELWRTKFTRGGRLVWQVGEAVGRALLQEQCMCVSAVADANCLPLGYNGPALRPCPASLPVLSI